MQVSQIGAHMPSERQLPNGGHTFWAAVAYRRVGPVVNASCRKGGNPGSNLGVGSSERMMKNKRGGKLCWGFVTRGSPGAHSAHPR